MYRFEYQSMFNKVKILCNIDEQVCPNIDNSESSFWVQLPEDCGTILPNFALLYIIISKKYMEIITDYINFNFF